MAKLPSDRQRIAAVEKIIRRHVRRTPVLEVSGSDFRLDSTSLIFKLEFLQHAGSFKARGAFTHLLTREVPAAGVVAGSGGNHGVAVAFAASKLEVPAKIFVPTVASPEKIERIRGYGAQLVITGERSADALAASKLGISAKIFLPTVASPEKIERIRGYGAQLVITGKLYADALAASEAWVSQSGAMPIHAYDQIETLLGQGTVGLEFEEQCPQLDTLLVAVGGGGLIGGVAAWYAGKIKLIGVEPEAAPTLSNALRAGRPVDSPAGGIAADSLAPKRVGELMFPIAQKFVSHVILVSDEEIVCAQEMLWTVLRIVAEPGGAAAFAALLSGRYQPAQQERVGILLCGGNTTAVNFISTPKNATANATR